MYEMLNWRAVLCIVCLSLKWRIELSWSVSYVLVMFQLEKSFSYVVVLFVAATTETVLFVSKEKPLTAETMERIAVKANLLLFMT